ncbi:hypothetical protein Tco_0045451 [Tanacetum coccineum]
MWRICACTSLKTTKEQDPIRYILPFLRACLCGFRVVLVRFTLVGVVVVIVVVFVVVDRIMVDVVEDVEIVAEVVVVVKDNISRVQRDSMKMMSLDVATSRRLLIKASFGC